MLNVTYGIIEEKYALGRDTRVSYGIAAYADAEIDGTATIVSSVHDITANKKSLKEFVKECNRTHLSTEHLLDVVEDFIEG